jgi:hypothetical protein
MAFLPCSECGEDVWVPDSWTLHQSTYEIVLCPKCKEKLEGLRPKDK